MLKNFLLKRPLLVVFDVTKRCNSKCNMCNIWKHPSKVKDELTLKQIENIFTDLHKFGLKQVFLQGGEPLLRKDIFEIIELMNNLGINPTIITNGILLNKKNALRLAGLKCNMGISFDTLRKSRYKKIRGVDSFNLVKKNILFASRIKRKKGCWGLNSTFSEVNYDECLKLYDFAVKKGFDYFAYPYNYSLCKASAKDQSLVFKNKQKIIDCFNKLLIKATSLNDIHNTLMFNETIKYLKGDYVKVCDALRYSIMLDERGRVGPCIEMNHEFDLKKESIKEVWPRFNRERVKQCYLKTPCFYGCTRSIGIMASNWLKLISFGLRNPNEAKRLMKLV